MSESGSDKEWPFLVSGQLASVGTALYDDTSGRVVACVSAEGGGVPGLFQTDLRGSGSEGSGLNLGRPVLLTSCFFRLVGGGGAADCEWLGQSRLSSWEAVFEDAIGRGVECCFALESLCPYRGIDTIWGTLGVSPCHWG